MSALLCSPAESPAISPTKNPVPTLQLVPNLANSGIAMWSASSCEVGLNLRSSIVAEDTSEIQQEVDRPTEQQKPAAFFHQLPAQSSPLMINGVSLNGTEGMPGSIFGVALCRARD